MKNHQLFGGGLNCGFLHLLKKTSKRKQQTGSGALAEITLVVTKRKLLLIFNRLISVPTSFYLLIHVCSPALKAFGVQ